MKLFIDIGNRRVKWATSAQINVSVSQPTDDPSALDKIISEQVINTHSSTLADQLSMQFKKLPAPESVWVSCVAAESIKTDIAKICQVIWKLSPICIRAEAAAGGVENCYENPASVGADRWAANIAARHVAGARALVVIDAGTAVTIDYVDSKGGFLGGLIFPGVATMIESLTSATGQIPAMTHSYSAKRTPRQTHYLNTDTRAAVENGVMLAVTAGIDRAIDYHLATKDSELKVIITGGDAECIIGLSSHDMKHEPNLVLIGLLLLSQESAQ
ncbi:type III pantothenate kinase [Candidatus Spongiihabitans sp.]|uniref:type III pantothenate kinase n=1 Tax=Candidatus Spongiihabitans sp. TaxID=3101308 RepID=UPI003C7A887D